MINIIGVPHTQANDLGRVVCSLIFDTVSYMVEVVIRYKVWTIEVLPRRALTEEHSREGEWDFPRPHPTYII